MQKNRQKLQRRKQMLFLICVGLILAAAAVGLIWKYNSQKIPTDFYINADADAEGRAEGTLSYNGKEYRYNEHLSNYLFLGIDTEEKIETYEDKRDAGQADAIFLVSYDRAKASVQCMVIPRDTITEISIFAADGSSLGTIEHHINLQYAYGDAKEKSCDLMVNAVSGLLYDMPIQGYCAMNMDGIPNLAEVVGGVEVIVPNDSMEDAYPEFAKGAEVTITAENAEQFVRYRNTAKSQSAVTRTERQKAFIGAFVEKTQQLYAQDAAIVSELYEGVRDYMITNMGNDLFVKLLEAAKGSKAETKVQTLPGKADNDGTFDVYYVDDDALFEMILDMFYVEG